MAKISCRCHNQPKKSKFFHNLMCVYATYLSALYIECTSTYDPFLKGVCCGATYTYDKCYGAPSKLYSRPYGLLCERNEEN